MLFIRENKKVYCIRLIVNAAINELAKQAGTCMNGLRSTIGLYGFRELSMPIRHANKTWHYPLWEEVKFIDRYPHCYSRRVKKVTRTRLHHNNINRDSGIEIPEAWMPTIRQLSSRPLPQWIAEETGLPTMPWIEIHQRWARFVIHQSLTTTVV